MYSKYLAGWEIDFNTPGELEKILITHGINKKGFEFFKSIQTATEIFIENDSIVKITKHFDSGIENEDKNIKLPVSNWDDREVFLLTKIKNGNHKIGGKCPDELKLPHHNNLTTPFIFIGSIDTSDTKFEWIGLPKLDIIFPIYECNFGVFLDYNDPFQPQILNPETFSDSWFDESIKGIDKVVFEENRFSVNVELDTEEYEDNEDNNLICGVPLWYQSPEIPTCPKTGEVMRFVCTINSDSSIQIQDKKGIENLPFADYLIFGDYGNLFVFFHPVSKIMHLKIQF